MHYQSLINGVLRDGAATLDVINPATEQVFATAAQADEAQLNEAVAAAKKAFTAWSKTDIAERREKLLAVAAAVEQQAEEFARLVTMEQGKPLQLARREVADAVGMLKFFSMMDLPDVVLKESSKERIVQQRKPLGVVAAIAAWNFPLQILAAKVAPALITGNTVVAKPAPTTPLSALLFAKVAAPILPPGVLNVIVDNNDLGAALSGHPGVAKVTFTGSTATGRRVMSSAAPSLKRLTLELGGNDAAIVLDDADPAAIARKIFLLAFINSGQTCIAIKRLYVPASLYDAVCDELVKVAAKAVVGDGLDEKTTLGPLQNKQQFERVKGLIADAKANGRLIAGGDVHAGKGYFIPPTLVRDIPDGARVVREEQFGPILPILAYDDLDDAVARANDSEFGLGASVWTSNPSRGLAVAKRLEAGSVWVNNHTDIRADISFGGAKQSGIGVEMGQHGLEEFTQATVIYASA
ncbi:MAG: aldehyde dehydrogenase family protein [Gammaproteobacteria bacterium]